MLLDNGHGRFNGKKQFNQVYRNYLNPSNHGGGPVGPSLGFCPSGNPYLKILDFSKLFIADAPMKKKSKNLVLTPPSAL